MTELAPNDLTPYQPFPVTCGDESWWGLSTLKASASEIIPLNSEVSYPMYGEVTLGEGPKFLETRVENLATYVDDGFPRKTIPDIEDDGFITINHSIPSEFDSAEIDENGFVTFVEPYGFSEVSNTTDYSPLPDLTESWRK